MAASEAASILKYFGRAAAVGSKPAQERTVKVMGTVTTAATMQRLGEPSRRPNLQAHTELSNDASRVLAFLQMHGSTGDTQPQGNVSPTIASRSTLYQQSFSETDRLHGSDRRYRNAGQTLQMMGFQNVANFSTQHQWLQARATLDMNVQPMIRARSGIPAACLACGLNESHLTSRSR